MEGLAIKTETLSWDGNARDWFYQQIADAIDSGNSRDFVESLDDAQINGTSLAMDFETVGRDGCFDEEQLFAVWEKKDVEMLIERLKRIVDAR